MHTRLYRKSGFTIVELLIVVAVIAILAAVAVVGYYGVQSNARDKSLLSDVEKVEGELTRYATKNGGLYDSSLNWDSSTGTNANIRFSPSAGNTIVVQIIGDGYCIKGFNPASNAKNLATAVQTGAGRIGCKSGWLDLISTSTSMCAIATNELPYCWGQGTNGQLGNGASVNSNIPVPVTMSGALVGKKVRSFATNQDGQHVCVIASDNNAYCWGAGVGGQLGNGASVNSNVPVAVTMSGALAGKTIKELHVVGTSGTCAIASDDNLYCWGTNTNGQLGNGTVGTSNVPVAVTTSGALAGKTIKQLSLGTSHRCVLASDNNAYCWGTNTNGQLGDGSIVSASTPVAVSRSGVLAGKSIRSINVTTGNTCVIASDNNAYCWGLGTSGQLGNGASVSASSPVAVSNGGALSGKFVQSLHGGNGYTCAIASDSAAYCWGLGTTGQLGNGTSAISNVPVAVSTAGVLSGKTVTSLSTLHSTASTCAITGDGGTFCWGMNSSGQLGNGNTSTQNAPVAVSTSGVLAGKKLQKVEISGNGMMCGIASDNNIYCWGFGTSGQLGNGASASSSVPVMVTRPSGL